MAYSTFANWSATTQTGTRYAPQVASEIVDPTTGKVVKKITPQVTGHVTISPANYAAMLAGFEGVVSSRAGTAYGDFQGFPASWNLAGKTGTASNATGLEPNSWFVAFGPNPNPQYLVLAVIEQGGYGADAAAPLVRNIFDYLVTNPITPVKTPTPSTPPSMTAPASNAPVGHAHDHHHHDQAGPERARADHDHHDGGPGRLSPAPVVGWPPPRS